MLSRVRWPSPSPRMPAATPAAMNALPRVVNPASSDPMRRPFLNLLLSNYDRLWSILVTGLFGSSRKCPLFVVPGRAPAGPATGALAQLGQWHAVDDRGENLFRGLPRDHRLGAGQQPVGQHGKSQRLHVVRNHKVTAVQGGPGPAGPQQVERC